MGCLVVAGFVLTSALRSPSAIAELLVEPAVDLTLDCKLGSFYHKLIK